MAGERRIGERRRSTTVFPPHNRAPPLTPDREAHRPIPFPPTRSRRIMLGVRSVSPAHVAGIGYAGLFPGYAVLFGAFQFRQLVVKPRTRVADLVAHFVTPRPQLQPLNDLYGHVPGMIR